LPAGILVNNAICKEDPGMDRVHFIKLGLGLIASECWLFGCGGQDDDGGGGTSGTGASGSGGSAGGPSGGSGGGRSLCTADATLVQTSSESHDHLPLSVPITAAQLNTGAMLEYALPIEQNHRHTLTLTAADLDALKSGVAVTKVSSNDNGHTHTYSITCL
jgi:hypothetical protein